MDVHAAVDEMAARRREDDAVPGGEVADVQITLERRDADECERRVVIASVVGIGRERSGGGQLRPLLPRQVHDPQPVLSRVMGAGNHRTAPGRGAAGAAAPPTSDTRSCSDAISRPARPNTVRRVRALGCALILNWTSANPARRRRRTG